MKFTPHPFQAAAIADATEFLRNATPGQRRLYSSPTGTGKSVMEAGILEALPGGVVVTPRQEIVDGLVDKGVDPGCIYTPVALRNRLFDGRVAAPRYFLLDESHHESAKTWQQLDILSGLVPACGFTATPYRGSPRSTREFLERWGEPVPIITYPEAAAGGYISLPTFDVVPLVDDDTIEVRGGEFAVESVDSAMCDRLSDLAEHCRQYYSGQWDRPTVVALPSRSLCARMREELARRGVPSAVVDAETPREERLVAFAAAKARVLALLHVNILSEGVDMPLRRLIDASPTMSPVRWVQQLGRITRPVAPGEAPPAYMCVCRNLLRHAYALEGCVPPEATAKVERVFPPSDRSHARVVGLEAIGRFRPTTVELLSGNKLYVYAFVAPVGTAVFEYCVLAHPTQSPVWAAKVNTVQDGVRQYGSWRACDAPEGIRGFASVSKRSLTEKQLNWWRRSAARFGIDPTQDVDLKKFVVLPVCKDLNLYFR